MKVYKAVAGSNLDDEAARVVGRALARLVKAHGEVTPEIVLDEASKDTSPLHSYFDWDDKTAAVAYRIEQAKHLIRSIKVVVEADGDGEDIEVRAFVSVESDSRRRYQTIDTALNDVGFRKQIIEDALNGLRAWENKYRVLSELAGLIKTVATKRSALERKFGV